MIVGKLWDNGLTLPRRRGCLSSVSSEEARALEEVGERCGECPQKYQENFYYYVFVIHNTLWGELRYMHIYGLHLNKNTYYSNDKLPLTPLKIPPLHPTENTLVSSSLTLAEAVLGALFHFL